MLQPNRTRKYQREAAGLLGLSNIASTSIYLSGDLFTICTKTGPLILREGAPMSQVDFYKCACRNNKRFTFRYTRKNIKEKNRPVKWHCRSLY